MKLQSFSNFPETIADAKEKQTLHKTSSKLGGKATKVEWEKFSDEPKRA